MKITIKQVTPWNRALNAARLTVNKEPLESEGTTFFKRSLLLSEHSPVRLVEYDIILEDIPNESMGHLVRHHIGVEKFVATLRNDRTDVAPENVTYLTPRKVMLSCNAQALINISRKRLCNKASKDTREIWKAVVEEMKKIDPIMANAMVPECVYRGFCPEGQPCGYAMTIGYAERINVYRHR